jgi:thiamine pyrophosphokinase
VQLTKKGARVQIVDGQNKMTALTAGTHRLSNDFSKIFSVFAVGETVKNLQISGVKYPLCGYDLECADSLCVSNEIVSGDAKISFDGGAVLLIFSKD